jgi:hypothetical protein
MTPIPINPLTSGAPDRSLNHRSKNTINGGSWYNGQLAGLGRHCSRPALSSFYHRVIVPIDVGLRIYSKLHSRISNLLNRGCSIAVPHSRISFDNTVGPHTM